MAAKKKKEYRISYELWSAKKCQWHNSERYRDAVSPEAAARSVARDEELPDDVSLVVEEIASTSYFTTTSKTIRNVEVAE